MRFESLELSRFGKFTDFKVHFPSHGTDFHLILGPNEAGKSTVRAAIADLLFGIEERSPFGFLHAYEDLRLGAVIAERERRLAFWRLKKRKNPLRDAHDRPCGEELLRPFLGDMDRAAFERSFCLDHQRLLAGGREILQAKDDLARLLFEASSGLTTFGQLREELEREAKQLYDRRRSSQRVFYQLLDELKSAEQAVKNSTLRPREWVEACRQAEEARAQYERAVARYQELESRRIGLERIRRVAPHLQEMRDAQRALEALAGTPRLPPGARAELDRAEREIDGASVLIEAEERALREIEQSLTELVPDTALLAAADAIRALADERARTRDHARDIEKRRAEAQFHLDEARRIARELDWQIEVAEALEARVPAQLVRSRIQELARRHGRLAQAVTAARTALAEQEEAARSLAQALEGLGDEPDLGPLSAAIDAARTLGESERRIEEQRQRARGARERLERALEALRPWTGGVNELRALTLPAEPEVQAHLTREQALEAALAAQREELARLRTELAALAARREALERAKHPVTHEELAAARAERDARWQAIRHGRVSLSEAASGFEESMQRADALADRRYAGAADIAAFEQLGADIAALSARIESQEQQVARAIEELDAHRAAWRTKMQAVGLGTLSPAAFLDWRTRLREALEADDRLAERAAELTAAEAAIRSAGERLHLALGQLGLDTAGALTLSDLLRLAEDQVRSAEARRARREALGSERQRAVETAERRRAELARAEQELAQWSAEWSEQLRIAGLDPALRPETAHEALDLIAQLSGHLQAARELEMNRIQAMQRDLERFASSASVLATALAPELAHESAETIARALEERLARARSIAEQRRALEEDARRRRENLEKQRIARERAYAAIRPLLRQAGLGESAQVSADDIARLRAVIERSERCAQLEQRIESARQICLREGENRTIDALEAELDAQDVASIPLRLEEIERERSDVMNERDRLRAILTEAEARLRQYGGQCDAATAEAQRQEAISALSDTVERYVKVVVAARLLRWSIDRYREEKQGPLLKRAGEIFQILTRGSFERLTVDFDEQPPQLRGVRPGGRTVDVTGMSDGTRDQLYLSLRLAALELQLDQGRALPFIADDLFINFDDERAEAGFQALAELATQTQVIFLTHHEHLLPIFERAIGPPVSIVRL